MDIGNKLRNNLHHIIESLLLTSTAGLLNYFVFPYAPLYEGIPLNPYLLIPVMLSIRYGSMRGTVDFILSVAVASYVTFIIGHGSYLFSRDAWLLIIGTMVSSQIAGVVSDKMRDQLEALRDECSRLFEDKETLRKTNATLSEVNRELSRKIVSRFDSMNTVYEASQKLETLDRRELIPATLDILKDHMLVKSASVYMEKNGLYCLESFFDSVNSKSRPDSISASSGMIADAISLKTTQSFIPFLDGSSDKPPDPSGGDCLIASPVIQGDRVAGLIIVEDMDFIDFTRSAVRMVEMVSEWTGSTLEKIRNYEEMADRIPDDPSMFGFKARFMKQNLLTELSKAVRFDLNLSALSVSVKDKDRMTAESLTNASSLLGYILKYQKREIDIFGAGGTLGTFLIILPVTDRKGMNIFADRIMKEATSFSFRPFAGSDEILDVEIRKVSLDDLIDRTILRDLPRGEISGMSKKVFSSMLIALGFGEEE